MSARRFLFLLFVTLVSACDKEESSKHVLNYSDRPNASLLPVYHLAVHPLHNAHKLSTTYQPLIDHLNQKIPHIRIELESSRDYQAFEEKYRLRQPEILLPNPWQTIQAMKSDYHVVAMVGDADDFKGIILVRKDSEINEPVDLKGKIVSYPSHTALAACIMPQRFFHESGISISADIINHYVGSQESSIMNVYLGKSVAGATWPPPWRTFQKEHPQEADQLKVIWQTPSLINNALMFRNDLPLDIQQAIQEVIFSLPESSDGQHVLSLMETNNIYPADNNRYQIVSDYIERFEKEVRNVEQP
jgi:phosphonate transport system substrate-binding protein